jgi:hypothetical protein
VPFLSVLFTKNTFDFGCLFSALVNAPASVLDETKSTFVPFPKPLCFIFSPQPYRDGFPVVPNRFPVRMLGLLDTFQMLFADDLGLSVMLEPRLAHASGGTVHDASVSVRGLVQAVAERLPEFIEVNHDYQLLFI